MVREVVGVLCGFVLASCGASSPSSIDGATDQGKHRDVPASSVDEDGVAMDANDATISSDDGAIDAQLDKSDSSAVDGTMSADDAAVDVSDVDSRPPRDAPNDRDRPFGNEDVSRWCAPSGLFNLSGYFMSLPEMKGFTLQSLVPIDFNDRGDVLVSLAPYIAVWSTGRVKRTAAFYTFQTDGMMFNSNATITGTEDGGFVVPAAIVIRLDGKSWTLGGGSASREGIVPWDINDLDQVVGYRTLYSTDQPLFTGYRYAVLWQPPNFTEFLLAGTDANSGAYAINGKGQVGVCAGQGMTFLWQAGTKTPIPACPRVMNDSGQYISTLSMGNPLSASREVVGDATTVREIELGGDRPWAMAINASGTAAGYASVPTTTGTAGRAWIWRDGVTRDLGTLGGASSNPGAWNGSPWPQGGRWVNEKNHPRLKRILNDADQIVGSSLTAAGEVHPFLWEDGQMRDLGTLGGANAAATAINSSGQVIGYSEDAAGKNAFFLYDPLVCPVP